MCIAVLVGFRFQGFRVYWSKNCTDGLNDGFSTIVGMILNFSVNVLPGDGEGDRYGQMSPSNINYEFSEGIPEMLLSRAKAGYVDDALLALELGYRPVKVVLVAIGEVYLKEVSS